MKQIAQRFLVATVLVSASISGQCAPADETPLFLYAKLEKTDAGYVFSKFSGKADKSEPWVSLPQGTPTWNTAAEYCAKGMVSERSKEACKTENEALFRTFSVSVGRSAALAVLTLGLGATMPRGEVAFDEVAFRKAYDEAMARAGLTSEKIQGIQKELQEALQASNAEFLPLRKRYLDSFGAATRSSEGIAIEDRSGLYRGLLNLAQFITVTPWPLVTPVNLALSVQANSLAEFSEKLNQALADARGKWQEVEKSAAQSCTRNAAKAGFTIEVSCPSTVPISNGKAVPSANVIVLSRNFDRLLPASINVANDTLNVTWENGAVKAINKSNTYISIDSISLYYNRKIASLHRLGREMPPQAEATLARLGDFAIDWRAISFGNLDAKSADRELPYGIAVKYRVLDTQREHTLFEEKRFRMVDLTVGL